MSADVVRPNPVVNLEPFERLLAELDVGDYENELGTACVWIPTGNLRSDRELRFRSKDFSGNFNVSLRCGRVSITVESSVYKSTSPSIHASTPTNERTEEILADLLRHLRGLMPVSVVSTRMKSWEDRVNTMLAEQNKPPYSGTPEVEHSYKRP